MWSRISHAAVLALALQGCSMSAADHQCVRDDLGRRVASSDGIGLVVLPALVPIAFAACAGVDGFDRSDPSKLEGSHRVLTAPVAQEETAESAGAGNADTVRLDWDGRADLGTTIPLVAIRHVERIDLGGPAHNVELTLDPRDVAAIGAEKTPLGDPAGFTFLVHLAVDGETGDRLVLDPGEGWVFAGSIADIWSPARDGERHFDIWEAAGVRIGVRRRITVVHGGPAAGPAL